MIPSIRYYQNVGNISFLRTEFTIRVKGKFIQKKKELEKLSGPKMKLKTKKIIAREGLIILGILILFGLSEMIGYFYFRSGNLNLWLLPDHPSNSIIAFWKHMNTIFLIYIYPFYWIIRFIVWAIKILKKNAQEKV